MEEARQVMQAHRRRSVVTALLVAIVSVAFFAQPATATTGPADEPPNVVFVLSDDLGYSDVGFHGSYVRTPFLDSLVKEGVELANYYGQSICTPSRAAIMTGRFACHTGLQHSFLGYGQDIGLPLKFKTLADHMNEAGYESHAVGKVGAVVLQSRSLAAACFTGPPETRPRNSKTPSRTSFRALHNSGRW